MVKKIHPETGGWFLEASSVMTNFHAKATNSIAQGTNSIAKWTNSIAKATNSIAKTSNMSHTVEPICIFSSLPILIALAIQVTDMPIHYQYASNL